MVRPAALAAGAGSFLLCALLAGCGREDMSGPPEDGVPTTGEERRDAEIPGGGTQDGDPAEAEDGLVRMRTAAVGIAAGGLSGSGVIYEVSEDGILLLTAGHVMGDAGEEASVTFYDGESAVCREFWVFPDADCAFLRVPRGALPTGWEERYLAVEKDRAAFDRTEEGSGIFLADPENENDFGYRYGMLLEPWIYVEDFGQYMMLLSGEAEPGMSGCGVFDEKGCFLGILCGENGEGELAVLPYSVADALCGSL